MPRISMVVGVLLMLLGAAFFTLTGAKTALIPAPFGLLIALCGYLAQRPGFRKHMMHAAIIIALLGAVGSGMQLPKVLGDADRSLAATEMSLMLGGCVVYIVLCVRSFIQARRSRQAL